jgi:hypothetical protein
MRKKILSIIFVIFILFLNSYIVFGVKASGNVATEERSVSKFHSVKLNCNGIVNITQGDSQTVIVKTDDNLFSNIKTEVKRGELIISVSGILTNVTTIEVDIIMNEINSLIVNSQGRMDVQGDVEVNDIKLAINGTGNISINIVTDFILSKIIGTGTITVSGTTSTHEIEIVGSGLVDAESLSSENAKLNISNGGNCKLYVKEKMEVNTGFGGGNVEYRGEPIIYGKMNGITNITYNE